MSIVLKRVTSNEDIEILAHMAHEIWHESIAKIIGIPQAEYMIDKFQSVQALMRDMILPEEPYEYWLVYEDDTAKEVGFDTKIVSEVSEGALLLGYTGGHNEVCTERYFVSKIYLYKEARGRGLASRLIRHYEQLAKERGLSALYLTVNKYNKQAYEVYLNKGFVVIDSVETDIGEGYIMDDYVMEKRLS